MFDFPCYFLLGEGDSIITNMVNGRQCLCFFTSYEAVGLYTAAVHNFTNGTKRERWEVPVDEVKDVAGLIERLENAEGRLAADGIKFISLDPVPGQPTKCASIRDFIQMLREGG